MDDLPINQVICGDNLMEMPKFPANSIHGIVTDPPYKLRFMNKEWDLIGDGQQAQQWHFQWATEAYRVLMPGASMLVMGGTRTFHRLMCALEDAGFIIKDTLMWLYGSGFPKAQDVTALIDSKVLGIKLKEVRNRRKIIGKREMNYPDSPAFGKINPFLAAKSRARKKQSMLPGGKGEGELNHFRPITEPLTPEAKEWDGWKVGGLKPAYEPIIWAVKPPEGSFTDNVLKYGVGAINVDGCRIELIAEEPPSGSAKRVFRSNQYAEEKIYGENKITPLQGRYPANVILKCICDEVRDGGIDKRSYRPKTGRISFNVKRKWQGCLISPFYRPGYIDNIKIHTNPECPCAQLDGQSNKMGIHGAGYKTDGKHCSSKDYDEGINYRLTYPGKPMPRYGDSGGASRFFKTVHTNPDCPCAQLDGQSGITETHGGRSNKQSKGIFGNFGGRYFGNNDSGGASRFFKTVHTNPECPCAQLDGQSNDLSFSGVYNRKPREKFAFNTESQLLHKQQYPDSGGASRFFKSIHTNPNCPAAMLDEQSGRSFSCGGGGYRERGIGTDNVYSGAWNEINYTKNVGKNDFGGASRFFYCAKASRRERNEGLEGGQTNKHPTVKPVKLIEWLIKLVTREGQIVLDPFLGSGTTAVACINTDRKWIGIEKGLDYVEISHKRIEYALRNKGLLPVAEC